MKYSALILFVVCLFDSALASRLKFVGDASIKTGFRYENTELGGLSGITYDHRSGEFLCISDERSLPRIYRFRPTFAEKRLVMEPVGVTLLRDHRGLPLPKDALDTEGIAVMADGRMYVSSEGDGLATPRVPPSVMLFDPGGLLQTSLPVPEVFLPDPFWTQTKGVLQNRGFESLSLTSDEDFLFTGSQEGLKQDAGAKGVVRILRYDLRSSSSMQFSYALDSLPGVGLNDIASLDKGHFLSLERRKEVVDGVTRFRSRIYLVDLKGATDITGMPGLPVKGVVAASKKLLLDLDDIKKFLSVENQELDNFEGMTFGPLVNGHPTLILVADNNFSEEERTLFVAFEFIP